ncbi:hypothetical protein KG318_003588 [Proteus mirabilis]
MSLTCLPMDKVKPVQANTVKCAYPPVGVWCFYPLAKSRSKAILPVSASA